MKILFSSVFIILCYFGNTTPLWAMDETAKMSVSNSLDYRKNQTPYSGTETDITKLTAEEAVCFLRTHNIIGLERKEGAELQAAFTPILNARNMFLEVLAQEASLPNESERYKYLVDELYGVKTMMRVVVKLKFANELTDFVHDGLSENERTFDVALNKLEERNIEWREMLSSEAESDRNIEGRIRKYLTKFNKSLSRRENFKSLSSDNMLSCGDDD